MKVYLLCQPEWEWNFTLSTHKTIEGAKDFAQKEFKRVYLEFLERWREELIGTDLEFKKASKNIPVLEWTVPEEETSITPGGKIVLRTGFEVNNEPEDIELWPTLDVSYNIEEFELLD